MSQLPDLKIIEASKGIELLENHEHENERDEQHAQDDHGHQDHDGHFHSSVNPMFGSAFCAIDEVKT